MTGAARRLVFISYARADADICDHLLRVLDPLGREGDVTIWADKDLHPGDRWNAVIKANLDRADVAVLLVSSHFLASRYIRTIELPELEKRAVPLVCVPVGACAWRGDKTISELQWALPPEKPLRNMRPPERELALVHVYDEVKHLLERLDAPTPVEAASATAAGVPVDPAAQLGSADAATRSTPVPESAERRDVLVSPWAVGLVVGVIALLVAAVVGLIGRDDGQGQLSAGLARATVPVPPSTVPAETSPSRPGAGTPPSAPATTATAPPSPTVVPAPPPASAAPPGPAQPPQVGQWRPVPIGIENHCMDTATVGRNLHIQICWAGAVPMMVVSVSGVTGRDPAHQVAVRGIWTVIDGVSSRGTSCLLKTFAIAERMVCIDETASSAPGIDVESSGRVQHDGSETELSTPRR